MAEQLLLPFLKIKPQKQIIYTPHIALRIEIENQIAKLIFQAPDGKRKELLAQGALQEIKNILMPTEDLKCNRQSLCSGCRLFDNHFLIFQCYRSADRCFYKMRDLN